ncbi:MAG: response regulator [Deltaproteobacteria bacterium]|nr:response regulator [Deltaproteobacteria bacterium]
MKKLKVLLVDDEEDFVATLAERLELREIETKIATDGETALDIIGKEPFSVIVLDLMMPGLSGLEVLQRIKQMNISAPVILLTGHGSTREGIEGMRLKAFDYLMKPLQIEELIKKIKEAAINNK